MKEMVVNVALTFHVARERVSCNKESLLGRGGEAKAASRKDREDPSRVLSISIKRDFLDFRTFSRSSDLGVKVNGDVILAAVAFDLYFILVGSIAG